jgi:hypothetical protein
MNITKLFAAMPLAVLCCAPLAAFAAEPPPRTNYGHQEHVRVVEATPIEVITILDPSIPYSVLNAIGIKYFQRDSAMWARFTIDNGSVVPGTRITLERPVIVDNKVAQQDGSVGHQPRVTIELCLGVQDFKTDVRLVERNGYTPPLILGKAALENLGTVDAQRQFTQEPRCVPPQSQTEAVPKAP